MPDASILDASITAIIAANVLDTDRFYLAHDVSGTPSDRYITKAELATLVGGGGGGGGTPGGSSTQIQFNDSSAFGGDAGLTYDKTNDALSVLGKVIGGNGTFTGAGVPSGVSTPTVLSVAKGTSASPNTSTSPVVSISDVFSGDPADGAGRVSIHTTLYGAASGDVETLSVTARQAGSGAVSTGGLIAGYFRTIVEIPGTNSSHFGGASTDQWYVKGDNTSWEFDIDNQCSRAISGATNATPIVITTTAAHTASTGDRVTISGVGGNTAANGTWAITVLSSTTFSLDTSVGNGAYTSGGTMVLLAGQDYGTAGLRSTGVIIAGHGLGKHTAAQVIDATSATSAFYTGLDIRPNAIDTTTARAIRIPNATSLYAWNQAVNASVQVIGLNSSNQVSIASGGASVLFGGSLLSPVLTTPQVNDTSADHQYVFAVSELAADRTVTLPLLTGNDTFVFADFAQTLTNKTLITPTIASFANATHDHDDAAGGGQLNAANVFSAGVVPTARLGSGTANSSTFLRGDQTWAIPSASAGTVKVELTVAVSDETTVITTGTNKLIFRMPLAMTLTGVRASLGTAASSGLTTVDINEGGVSVLSTKLSIDGGEKTSTTAATPAVISDTALADDAEISIDIDAVGAGSPAGLKVTLLGERTDGAGVFPVADTQTLVKGSGDGTKLLRFEVDGFTTGTTRVATWPDADLTVVGLATTQTLTNKTLTSPVLTTPTISGAIIFPDGVRQTFNPDGTNAGLNVGSHAGDPSTPTDGDVWYNSSTPALRARINGATVSLGTGGGGTPGGSDTQLQRNNAGAFGGISGATSNGTDLTLGSGNLISTRPKFITSLDDTNGNEVFEIGATASAVNQIKAWNASTGNYPKLSPTGGDTDVGLIIEPKAAGTVDIRNGSNVQKFRVFGVYTDASNYRGIQLDTNYAGGTTRQALEAIGSGSGANPSLWLVADQGNITFRVTGGSRWTVQETTGHFASESANTIIHATTTPAQITANQNNYNPGGISYFQRWSTDASRNITGLTFSTGQAAGQIHVIVNVGSTDIVLKHQDAASTAGNRFLNSTGADITLTANQAAEIIYDGTTSRWRVFKCN